jgi:1-acyl-sn-glycerol-3-phosphate acyltransferase
MMRQVMGGARIILGALLIVAGMIVIVLLGMTGRRVRGVPASQWVATCMARCFNVIFNVRLEIAHRERLSNHRGFIVANHVSYLDIVSLMAAQPLRMLAAAEVKSKPVIGWAASGAGAVYVDRSSLRSRRDAMMSILQSYQTEQDPPIAVFVEGRMGTADCINPFQLGIFKLAKRNDIAYLPVAIRYDRPDIVVWHGRDGETMVQAAWRLACFPGPVHVKLMPLDIVRPVPSDNAAHLADAAQAGMADAVGVPAVKA